MKLTPRPSEKDALAARNEAGLVARAQGGDRDALTDLIRAHQDPVYSICLRMVGNPDDAADLAHDVLTKMLTNLERFDGRSRLATWLTRISINTCLSHMRRRRLKASGADYAPPSPLGAEMSAGRELSPASCVEENERKGAVLEALTRISDEDRALLVLRDVRGMEYRQLAEVFAVPVGTIKSRIFRARAALRSEMEKQEQVSPLQMHLDEQPSPSTTSQSRPGREAIS